MNKRLPTLSYSDLSQLKALALPIMKANPKKSWRCQTDQYAPGSFIAGIHVLGETGFDWRCEIVLPLPASYWDELGNVPIVGEPREWEGESFEVMLGYLRDWERWQERDKAIKEADSYSSLSSRFDIFGPYAQLKAGKKEEDLKWLGDKVKVTHYNFVK